MKRGRVSAADLSVVPIRHVREPVQPPAGLTAAEVRMFRELVASCPPDNFVESDAPLLVSYVQATMSARRCAKLMIRNPKLATVWEKFVRTQGMLATRLRLAPQSRIGPRTVARRYAAHHPDVKPPWEKHSDDD